MTSPWVNPFKKEEDKKVTYRSPNLPDTGPFSIASPDPVAAVGMGDVHWAYDPGKPEVNQTPASQAYSELDRVDRSRTPWQMTPDEMERHKGWEKYKGAGPYGTELQLDVANEFPADVGLAFQAWEAGVGAIRQWTGQGYSESIEKTRHTVDRANRVMQQSLNDKYRVQIEGSSTDPNAPHWNAEDDTYYSPESDTLSATLGYFGPGKIKDPKTGEDMWATIDALTEAGLIPAAINPETGQAITDIERHAMAEQLQPLAHQLIGGGLIDPLNFVPLTGGPFRQVIRAGRKALTTSREVANAFPHLLDYIPTITPEMRNIGRQAAVAAALMPVTGLVPGGGGGGVTRRAASDAAREAIIDAAESPQTREILTFGTDHRGSHPITQSVLAESEGMIRSKSPDAEIPKVKAEIMAELEGMAEARALDDQLQPMLYTKMMELSDEIERLELELQVPESIVIDGNPNPSDVELVQHLDVMKQRLTEAKSEFGDIKRDIDVLTVEGKQRDARAAKIRQRDIREEAPLTLEEAQAEAIQSVYAKIAGTAEKPGYMGELQQRIAAATEIIDEGKVPTGRGKVFSAIDQFLKKVEKDGFTDDVLDQVGVRVGGEAGIKSLVKTYKAVSSGRTRFAGGDKEWNAAKDHVFEQVQKWVSDVGGDITPGSKFTRYTNVNKRREELEEAIRVVNSPDFPKLIGHKKATSKKQPFQLVKLNDKKAADKAVDALLEKNMLSENGAQLIRWWLKAQETLLDSPKTFDPELFKVMNSLPPAYQWELAGNDMITKLWDKWDGIRSSEMQKWGPEAGTRYWTKRHYAMFGGARGDIRRSMRDIEHGEVIRLQKKADELATHEAVVVVDRDHPYGVIVEIPRSHDPSQPMGRREATELYRSLGDEEFDPNMIYDFSQSWLDPEAQTWLDLAMFDDAVTIIPIGEATPLKVLEASTRMLQGDFQGGIAPQVVNMMQSRPREAYGAWMKIHQQFRDAVDGMEEFKKILTQPGRYEPVTDPQTGATTLKEIPGFAHGGYTTPAETRAQRQLAEHYGIKKSGKRYYIPEIVPFYSQQSKMYRNVSRWIAQWKQMDLKSYDPDNVGALQAAKGTTRKPNIAPAEFPIPSHLGFTLKPYFDSKAVPEHMVQSKFDPRPIGTGGARKYTVTTEDIGVYDFQKTVTVQQEGFLSDVAKVQHVYDAMQKHLRPDDQVRFYTPEEMDAYVTQLHAKLVVEVPFLLLDDTNVLEMIQMGARPLRMYNPDAPRNWDIFDESLIDPRTGRIKSQYGTFADPTFGFGYEGGKALEDGVRRIMDSTGSSQGKVRQLKALLSSADLVPGNNTDAWTELAALIWKAQIIGDIDEPFASSLLTRIKDQYGIVRIESHPSAVYYGDDAAGLDIVSHRMVPQYHPAFNSDKPFVDQYGRMNRAAMKMHKELLDPKDPAARMTTPDDGIWNWDAATGSYKKTYPSTRLSMKPKSTEVQANQAARAEMYDDPKAAIEEIKKVEGDGSAPPAGGSGDSKDYRPAFQWGEDGDFNPDKLNWLESGLLNIVKRFLDDTAWAKRVSNIAAKSYRQRTGRELSSFDSSEVMLSMARSAPNSVRERLKVVSTQFRGIAGRSKTYALDEFEYMVNELLIYKQFMAITARPELALKTLKMLHRVTGEKVDYGRAGIEEKMRYFEALDEYGLLEEAADVIRSQYKRQLSDMVDYGLVSLEKAAMLRQMYPDYVPIQYIEAALRESVSGLPPGMKLAKDPIEKYDVPTLGGLAFDTYINAKFKLPTHSLSQTLTYHEFMGRLNKSIINFVEEKHQMSLAGRGDSPIIIDIGEDRAAALSRVKNKTRKKALQTAFPGRSDMNLDDWVVVKYREDGDVKGVLLPKYEAEVFTKMMEPNKAEPVSRFFNRVFNTPMKAILVHYNPTFPVYQMTIDMFAVAHQHGISAAVGGTAAELFRSFQTKFLSKPPDEFLVKMNELVGTQGWHTELGKRGGSGVDLNDWVYQTTGKVAKQLGKSYNDVLTDEIPNASIIRLSMNEIPNLLKNPLAFVGATYGRSWTQFANALEMAPRKAAARHVYNKGQRKGYDEVGNQYNAALALKRSTGDFTRGGTVTKALDPWIAFVNISAQGIALPFRAFKNHPRTFALTASLMTAANLSLFAWNSRNPSYYDVPLQYRQGFIVMLPTDPTDINKVTGRPNPKFIRLPIPGHLREWAMMYGTQTHALETMHKHMDGGAPEGMFQGWIENMLLGEVNPTGSMIRQAGSGGTGLGRIGLGTPGLGANMLYGLYSNEDPYSGEPIVPDYMANRALEDQWNSGTSIAARKIGPAIGMSPLKMDILLDLPLISEVAGITSIVMAASEIGVAPQSVFHAKELWAAMEHMSDPVDLKNLQTSYITNNVPPDQRDEVRTIIRQMERGDPILGELALGAADQNSPTIMERVQHSGRTLVEEGGRNLPIYGTFKDRVLHQHSGTLHRYAKERAAESVGATVEETNAYLSDFKRFTRAYEQAMWENDKRLEETGDTRAWRHQRQTANLNFMGALDAISFMGSDKAIANREAYTQDDRQSYWREYGKVMDDFQGASPAVKAEINYRLYRELTPLPLLDKNGVPVQGETNWVDFFDRQDEWKMVLREEQGNDAVLELEKRLSANMTDSERTYEEVKKRSIQPYYQETRESVYSRLSRSSPELVRMHKEYSLMPTIEKTNFKNNTGNFQQVKMIDLVDKMIGLERKNLLANNEQLEVDLVMYGYIADGGPLALTGLYHQRSRDAWNWLGGL